MITDSRFLNYLKSNNIKFLSFYPILGVDNKFIKVVPKGLTEEDYYSILYGSKMNLYLFDKSYTNRNSASMIESYFLGTPYCILRQKNQFDFINQDNLFFSNINNLIEILEKGGKNYVAKPYKQLNKILIK